MNAIEAPLQHMSNEEIANRLERLAELLEAQKANIYRVRAYRQAAETLRHLGQSAHEILQHTGLEGLRRLPNIGESISRSIEQLIDTGKINLLEQLEGQIRPERILATVPGIGPKLAARIHEQLGVETLHDLENAAWDGRLDQVPGFGQGRLRGVRESLAGRFRHRRNAAERPTVQPPADQLLVGELLEIDREYRQKAQADRLPRIAPRRFNPTGAAWLPILHTERGAFHYTALYSNTARAHELGATYDWVVIYRDDHDGAGQWTVVTARFGVLQGKRIVRGCERESEEYYRNLRPENERMRSTILCSV